MKNLDRVFFYAAAVSIVASNALSIQQSVNDITTVIPCTVNRVVNSESDEPVVNPMHDTPYTVLSHEPKWQVFTLPGELGSPGEIIYIKKPEVE